jgi:putative transposase
MPKTTIHVNRIIRSPQVLEAFIDVVRPRLPLELQGTRITADDILYVLAYASVHRLSLDAACAELEAAPSANRFREVLGAALPERPVLQRQLNTLLRAQLPKVFGKGKRAYNLAIDLTLIPYHGQPQQDEREVARGAAKSGTTHFHAYATVSIVHDKHRYVLALVFVDKGTPMVTIVRQLLDRVQRLKIKVRRVYLDKGFCSVPVFKTLARRHLSYIVPIPVRGKSGGVRRLFQGRASYQTPYTLTSPQHGTYTVTTVVVRRYSKGKAGQHGVRWFVYAVAGLPARMCPTHVFELYRQRFGIETSYRQMNQVRARTTSRNPTLRLLLVGLAFILVNLYVALRDRLSSASRHAPATASPWLSLRRLALLLGRAVEQQFGVTAILQRRRTLLLS